MLHAALITDRLIWMPFILRVAYRLFSVRALFNAVMPYSVTTGRPLLADAVRTCTLQAIQRSIARNISAYEKRALAGTSTTETIQVCHAPRCMPPHQRFAR